MGVAITTTKGHVARAIDFARRSNEVFFKLGKTTAWSDDMNPPVANPQDEVIEVLGYKKAELVSLVVPDPKGNLKYRDQSYRAVEEKDAYKDGAKWVFLRTNLLYNELPVDVSYRQVGISVGVKPKAGNESKYALVPSEVDFAGIDEVLDNRRPVYRSEDTREDLSVIIEF